LPWSPSAQDYIDIFNTMNPWHRDGKVPESLAKKRRRPLAECLWRYLAAPVIDRYQVVIGPRRVGKTVAMYQTVQQLLEQEIHPRRLWWLHMAHPLLMEIPLGALFQAIVEMRPPTPEEPLFVFVDELTYAPKWDAWLKTIYDERSPVRLVGTSSSTAALQEGRIESGVGRWEEQYLAPCLFTEYLHLRGKPVPLDARETLAQTIEQTLHDVRPADEIGAERQRFILVGGFPELLIEQEPGGSPSQELADELYRSQRVLREDAVQKAIYQDIPQVFGVQNPFSLERLLYTLAGQIAGLVSPQKLGQSVGVSAPTVESYLSYLQRSYVVFLLHNYAPKEETIQRRGRKLYFVDGAVRNAALHRGTGPLRDPAELGLLFENAVASHLHALSYQNAVRLYHWRQGRIEVDFVYDDPARPLAFEIASSAGHRTDGIEAFQQRFPKFRGGCYLVYPNAPPTAAGPDGRIGRIPLDLLLIAASVQAESELRRRLTGPPRPTHHDGPHE
jgi:uncharacterized protein